MNPETHIRTNQTAMHPEISINLHNDGYILTFAGLAVKAAVGHQGVTSSSNKCEGDGKTPSGCWPLRRVYYRPDRITLPDIALNATAITPSLGWCDDPEHDQYNQIVTLPFDGRHETLWRDDHAYDVVIPLGYNDDPPIAGRGSAIFFHLLHPGRHNTEGCVAIAHNDMMALLPLLTEKTVMRIADKATG